MENDYYSTFIEEVFLHPIRSVLIVDDDYPTFDEILEARIKYNHGIDVEQDKSWNRYPDQVKQVIDTFRAPDRPLLVDIHDGSNVALGEEAKAAAHLHQSDLLVLDYELDKLRPQDGAKAIEIIRNVMKNDHFNLVIIHTHENLDVVFRDVLIGLLKPIFNSFSLEEVEAAESLIEAAGDDDEKFGERLLSSIQTEQYLHSRLNASSHIGIMQKGQQPYARFKAECESAAWPRQQWPLILRYAFRRVEQSLLSRMNRVSEKELVWRDGNTKWIYSNSAFIAFSQKSEDNDLYSELLKALGNWNPQPSRLFLAKLRAEIDEYGVVAQAQALGNKSALALWYTRLLEADDPARRWLVAESVARHSDQLLGAILPRVEEFARRLVQEEREKGTAEELVKDHFSIDLRNKGKKRLAEREHNAFVCSKPPEGWHLTTGHVFFLSDYYWICLTPACDMVPSQISRTIQEEFGKRLPFLAVRLEPVRDEAEISDVHTNRYVFLNLDGSVKCFRFSAQQHSAPFWRTLFAEKLGQFAEGTFNFKVSSAIPGTKKLKFHTASASVVSQLRYSYALNLMQKLGVTMTRIGLDFV